MLSSIRALNYGVPQGSIPGFSSLCLYPTPIRDIMRRDEVSFHLYADDTQSYLFSFEAAIEYGIERAQCRLDTRIRDGNL